MITEENISFAVDDGAVIEGALAYDDELRACPGLVLCSPHPQLGGDMHNNIIEALYRQAAARGMVCLRFNYRGVGGSATPVGTPSQAEELKMFWESSRSPLDGKRLLDARGALDYLRTVSGVDAQSIFLAGYSFGAHVVQQLALDAPDLAALALIAPTIHFHSYAAMQGVAVPKLVVSSDNDFSYALEDLEKIYNTFAAPRDLKIFPGADHFFIGQEGRLSACVIDFLLGWQQQNGSCRG